jgi:FkbM family methyltransferase
MLPALKRWLRHSPLGPTALALHRLRLSPAERAMHDRNRAYDRETSEVLRRVLAADSNCLDVGAHAGSILEVIVRLAPRGVHHAFEPLPSFAALLRRKFPGVIVVEAAVGEQAGEARFVHVANAPAYSGLRERTYDRADPVLKPIDVRVVTIDDVVPPDQPVAFVKLDIEGGEYHALRGALGTIRRCRPIVVFEAGARGTGRYGVTAAQFFALLRDDLGYRVSTMERWLAARPAYSEAEFVDNWERGPEWYFIGFPADR